MFNFRAKTILCLLLPAMLSPRSAAAAADFSGYDLTDRSRFFDTLSAKKFPETFLLGEAQPQNLLVNPHPPKNGNDL
jgi:hypothetical protein